MERQARIAFLKSLAAIREGYLEIVCRDNVFSFGHPQSSLRAVAEIHSERFFLRAVLGADVGMGESYMDGDWTTPDLVALVRVITRNLRHFDMTQGWAARVRSLAFRLQHHFKDNNLRGSRRNISAHYDLGNNFYKLFLDSQMVYSCAYFAGAQDSLESAQVNKLDRICRKLHLQPGDRVLEIGCGWGAFAIHAARHYGAHVTGVTISQAQFDWAKERLGKESVSPGSVTIVLQDYRTLQGQFDKIVSIEMFEAVGLSRYDEFFSACDRLLTPNGSMLLQTITMPESELEGYRKRVDWIQKYIFPGSELAYLSEIQNSLGRVTQMSLANLESMGLHYTKTLKLWREHFFAHLKEVNRLGFDSKFTRMWDFYLAWCAGAFQERYINVVQAVLAKTSTQLPLLGDPAV